MIGITSYGAYIPRLRLDRMSIFKSMGWFAPAIMMTAQGERSMCNWDEDSITMAVAAARDCLTGNHKNKIDGLFMASTTMPFADRQNAGVIAAALNLREDIITSDFSASQKAGTTALVSALEAVKSKERGHMLVTAADRRETRSAYFYEMWYGDGAAAVSVGNENVIAEYLGSYSVSRDFVEHYRGSDNKFDYAWEERWARDEGYSKIIPEAVDGLLKKLNLTMSDVDRVAYPCFFKGEHKKIARKMGAAPEKVVDNMHEVCGETGTAHALLMLSAALETAKPDDLILVAGFGQGCNALLFRVTKNIANPVPRTGVKGALAEKETTDNYARFLRFRGLLPTEMGIRAEAPAQTAMTTLYRKREMILGMVGGKCRECGTPQFPKMDICVNPDCGAFKSQEDYEFADMPAHVKTFTGDLLAVSVDPPHIYGMVQFDDGGRFMADFTDCSLDDVMVGLPVKLVFRKRAEENERGFVNYFWKAMPVPGAPALMNRIDFDGRVAVITGAGGGLGRVYALELAKRGASVVVNDLGGSRDGSGGGSASPADQVVEEIRELGGEAVASYDNVATAEGGENIVQTALNAFGRVDIVINNAGILRDKSFLKQDPNNWRKVVDVHLNGAYNVTRPAFKVMKENGYGRIVMTTSGAGLYGNFGQTNYSSAKMGLVGLMNSLKLEGNKHDIRVNTVAPLAASRLTEDIMPPDVFEKMKPECVSPLTLFLCSEKCRESGRIYNAGMSYFNRAAVMTGPAVKLGDGESAPTVEMIHEHFDAINSLDGAREMADLNAALFAMMAPPSTDSEKSGAAGEGEMSPGKIFGMMPGVFQADAAEGVDVVFQYSISGATGGHWFVTVKDGRCTVASGNADNATCTLKMEDGNFVRMLTGKLDAMQAFTSGKLAIEGDVMKSQLIEKLFKFNF